MMDAVGMLRNVLLEHNKRFVQSKRLVERLSRETGLQRDDVIAGLRILRENGEIACADWFRGEPVGRVQLAIDRPHSDATKRWDTVLYEQGLNEADRKALLSLGEVLQDWELSDLYRLARGMVTLRDNIHELQGSRYQISARYLLGSSKLLDALPAKALRVFGIDPYRFSGAPSYVITSGPSEPECVVLVENPQAMELALQTEQGKRIAWVATFGYGLSHSGDEYGQQLARLVEHGKGLITLVRDGTPPAIEDLLQHPRLYYWGDLDREGLRIYWRLKSRLPQLQLSGLYQPMQAMLESTDHHHPYTSLVAKPNQNIWHCSEPGVVQLLKACTERALDQEALTPDSIRQYAHTVYICSSGSNPET